MSSTPIFAFSAWSGTGKTTIIEQLIVTLKAKGFRVAALKHDAHDFEIDREGKDSWRFSHAGADITVIQSQQKTALIEQRSLNLSDVIGMIHDVDVILAEGYNEIASSCADSCNGTCSVCTDSFRLYRIGISRTATGKGLREPAVTCIAIMTDDPSLSIPSNIKIFALDDITGLADYLIELLECSLPS